MKIKFFEFQNTMWVIIIAFKDRIELLMHPANLVIVSTFDLAGHPAGLFIYSDDYTRFEAMGVLSKIVNTASAIARKKRY